MPKNIFIPDINHFKLLEKTINLIPDLLFDYYFIFNNSGTQMPFNTKHLKLLIDLGYCHLNKCKLIWREYYIYIILIIIVLCNNDGN